MKKYRISASKLVNYDVEVKANSYEEACENFEMYRWQTFEKWDEGFEILDVYEEQDEEEDQ